MMRSYFWPVVFIIAALALIFGGTIVGMYTDWLWFSNIGYATVYSTIFFTRIKVGLLLGFLFFCIVYGNLWYARRIAPPPSAMSMEQQLLERLGRLARRGIGLVIFGASIVLAAMVGLEASTHWEDWLRYFNPVEFAAKDPVFGRDIGFYAFQLPFLNYIYHWLFFAFLAAAIGSIALHYADEAVEVFGNRLQFAPKVKSHVLVLVAILFFLKAWGYKLSTYAALNSRGGLFHGAGYTDIHARIPALNLLVIVAVICGILVLVNVYRRGIGLAVAAFLGLMGLSVLAGTLYPGFIQLYEVKPNELEKEAPYVKRAIAATQTAYGLTDIVSREFAAESSLTAAQVTANQATIENVRLWDKEHLLDAYNQIQTIQQYYTFTDVDVDRYWLTPKNGGQRRYRQVWLSARELSQSSLPETSQTWVNKHLQYTHGYGFCMSPVNEVSTEGLPEFFVKDIPPKTTVDIPIDRMGVYFGEETDEYVFVKTTAQEFDYPVGAENQTAKYEARSGVRVGGILRRLLFAARFSDINVLLNDNIKSQSKILYQREITRRMEKLLPFLMFDSDPYLVTVNGRMYWMRDAYTVTDAYPYSRHLQMNMRDLNYIRNSVKVVVDAYTGDTDAYIIQKPLEDPIIESYDKIFKGVLKPISKMPADLREHIRYPEDLFKAQSVIYQQYHQSNPTVFYNNSDQWSVPARASLTGGDEQSVPMDPYYMIMKLPNGQSEEFILMTPFIRAGKFNMVSWMCGKCDAEDYGRLILYRFPRDKNVFGPQQIAARARQNTDISEQITLWSQQGSSVSSGNLLVIPIESSLLYVMPLYLESTSTKIPELKRVIVAMGDKVAMAETLNEALTQVVGTSVREAPRMTAAVDTTSGKAAESKGESTGVVDSKRLVNQAVSQYEKAIDAQKRGDWAAYGEQISALRNTLKELQKSSK